MKFENNRYPDEATITAMKPIGMIITGSGHELRQHPELTEWYVYRWFFRIIVQNHQNHTHFSCFSKIVHRHMISNWNVWSFLGSWMRSIRSTKIWNWRSSISKNQFSESLTRGLVDKKTKLFVLFQFYLPKSLKMRAKNSLSFSKIDFAIW